MFAHFSPKRTRDWEAILRTLWESLESHIQHVILVEKIEYDDHFATPGGWLDNYAQFCMDHWAPISIYKATDVRRGIEHAKDIAMGGQILVTGSLYLVEAALEILKNEAI
jgi:folylpolyglutamate synthase